MSHPAAQELASIDLFAELDAVQLQKWAQVAEISRHSAGVTIREAGQGSHGVVLLLDGTIEAVLDDNGTESLVSDHLAISTGQKRCAQQLVDVASAESCCVSAVQTPS